MLCLLIKESWALWITINKLPPLSRVLLEKLIVTQLVKKFLTFYGA